MPSKVSHLSVVRENTATIEWLCKGDPAMPQWVVTVAFYKALHIIEAVFAADKKSVARHTQGDCVLSRYLKRTFNR
jgi:hypothetical protein